MNINLPQWLKRDKLKLPPWAKIGESAGTKRGDIAICIDVDTDGYIKEWLGLLSNPKVDQYWLEVCYQCAKMDVQAALAGTEYDPRICNKSHEIRMKSNRAWALKAHPVGRGAHAATQGKEARAHYKRIRGSLPM